MVSFSLAIIPLLALVSASGAASTPAASPVSPAAAALTSSLNGANQAGSDAIGGLTLLTANLTSATSVATSQAAIGAMTSAVVSGVASVVQEFQALTVALNSVVSSLTTVIAQGGLSAVTKFTPRTDVLFTTIGTIALQLVLVTPGLKSIALAGYIKNASTEFYLAFDRLYSTWPNSSDAAVFAYDSFNLTNLTTTSNSTTAATMRLY
ncbi:hypothetical protein B0H10DRAFT_2202776 [Mycena sp. CBHHK59/15]|nr:hypothetical protein B0H10DRAFT_2202776 [Mycena sp. CBHHK59/15]